MIERLLARLARALHIYRIPYMIIGGQAVLFYGSPRLTHDVDVTLGVDTDALPMIDQVCQKAKLLSLVRNPKVFVHDTHVLPTEDIESRLRVDFIFSNTPYERQAIHRARRVRIGRTTVHFASFEDLVIHKLVSGRAIDVEDVRTLLARHRSQVNGRYIRRWLREFAELETLKENPLSVFNHLYRTHRRTKN